MLLNPLKARLCFAFTALLGLAAFEGDAAAGPGASIPGLACIKVGTLGVLNATTDGAIANGHNSETLTVECPIPWDASEAGSSGVTVQIEYVDSSPANFSCTVRSEQLLTNSVSSSNFTSAINSNNWQTVERSVSATNGALHVRCSIPPVESGTGEASFLVTLRANQP